MLFRLHTPEAAKWVKDHVSGVVVYFGTALPVEPRYAVDLAIGMKEDGLTLE
jgi:hypothetical protein